jgi:hypothetical protein
LGLCAFAPLSLFNAQMAKLVDALVSGTSVSDDVQVRVLFWAQNGTAVQRYSGAKAKYPNKKDVLSDLKYACLKPLSHCASEPLSHVYAQMVKLVDTPA